MRGLALALWVVVMVPVGASAVPWETTRKGVIAAGSGFVSAHSLVQHVGLGQTSTVERIEIDWPAGHRTVHGPLPADRRHEIREE